MSSTSSSVNESAVEPGLLPDCIIQSFRRAVLCFAVVHFNLDLGPELALVFPPVPFSQATRSNIAFSSMPEGDLPGLGSHSYSWRIPWRGSQGEDRGHLIGFVWFSAIKDDKSKRGHTQRSLVLITQVDDLPGLFAETLGRVAQLYFKHGSDYVLDTAVNNIASWPAIEPGATAELPILGEVVNVRIPLGAENQWQDAPGRLAASKPASTISQAFHSGLSFSSFLLIWELLMLNEPILVYASDPRTGSDFVLHLLTLIAPIRAAYDWRPYFHLHDIDFRDLANSSPPRQGLLLATSNPLVLKTCSHWPHIIRLNTKDPASKGLVSARKRHLKKDPRVAALIDRLWTSGDYAACDSEILKHLSTLTEQFLGPLSRYFGSLGPLPRKPRDDSPRPSSAFSAASFMKSLNEHGTSLKFRATNVSSQSGTTTTRFYERFLRSNNFASWLRERVDKFDSAERARWLAGLNSIDWSTWERENSDKDVEDMVNKLESHAMLAERDSSLTRDVATSRGLRAHAKRLRQLREAKTSTDADSSDASR